MQNIISFDIEDNFTREELRFSSDWDKYEPQVIENTRRILALLASYKVKATFFVVAKIVERRPPIIDMIMEGGHEVASHGYIHERVNVLGREGFREDVARSREIIAARTGKPLKGFRAMAFSITNENTWTLDCIKDQGFVYDSSIVSAYFKKNIADFRRCFSDSFVEVSPSSFSFAGRNMGFGGGIFFRTAPYSLIRAFIKRENNAGRPAVIYAHAWEFNKDQPKVKVPLLQALAESPVTFTTPNKVERLIREFSFTSMENYLESNHENTVCK